MSFVLSKEQQLIRQNARDFAKQHLEPIKVHLDRTSEYPADAVRLMAEQDFLGLFIPAEYGGAEAGYISNVLVLEELSRVCAAAASILNHASRASYVLNRWGTSEQKAKYLPAMAAGEKLGAFALNEVGPALGVGPDAVIATKQGDGYVLNGRKAHIGNAGVAGIYVVLASTDPTGNGKRLTALLIDANTPGLSVGPPLGKMGLHGFPTADVVFENVTVAAANVLGGEGHGQSIAEEMLAVAGVADAAQTLGISQAAAEEAAEYSRQRVQFGQPIGNFEAVQSMLAEVITHCYLARLATYDTARLIEQGEPFMTEAAMVKWFSARIGPESLMHAVQIEGGYGYVEEGPLARMYRDLWGTAILESPAEFPQKVIAASVR